MASHLNNFTFVYYINEGMNNVTLEYIQSQDSLLLTWSANKIWSRIMKQGNYFYSILKRYIE